MCRVQRAKVRFGHGQRVAGIVVGPSPDNTKSVTYVVFAEGKVVVDLEFDSGSNDAAPQDFVLDVAKKQDDAVKTRVTS